MARDGIDLQPGGRISVWELGEFVFCQRAGWIARRAGHTGETYVEDDASYGSLGYLPDYDAARLREALQRMVSQLVFSVGLAALLGAVFWVLHDHVWPGFFWTGVGLLSPLPVWWFVLLKRCWTLWRYLRNHLGRAVAREVPDDLTRPTPWNWWDFHQAGFQVVKPKAASVDPDLNLDGRPWRLLVRGSVRIPVFRKHKGGSTVGKSQFATLAAYSHLIDVSEQAPSPFGVILFPGTWEVLVVPTGYDVPPTPVTLDRYRRMLADSDPPPEPGDTSNRCRGCPHGQPRELVTDRPATWALDRTHYERADRDLTPLPEPSIHVLDGRSVRPMPAFANNGFRYHSLCGDLFEWVPPHDGATRLALTLVDSTKAPAVVETAPQVVAPIQVIVNNYTPPAGPPVVETTGAAAIRTTVTTRPSSGLTPQTALPRPAAPPLASPRDHEVREDRRTRPDPPAEGGDTFSEGIL